MTLEQKLAQAIEKIKAKEAEIHTMVTVNKLWMDCANIQAREKERKQMLEKLVELQRAWREFESE